MYNIHLHYYMYIIQLTNLLNNLIQDEKSILILNPRKDMELHRVPKYQKTTCIIEGVIKITGRKKVVHVDKIEENKNTYAII